MRIVHLANFFGPRSGGLRTMMLEAAKAAQLDGHSYFQIVPGPKDAVIEHPHFTQYVIKSPLVPRSGGYRMITRTADVQRRLEEIAPDVVEISDRLTLLSLADWARKQGIPSIMFAHERIDGVINSHFRGILKNQIADSLNRSAANRVDAIVATTEFAATEFRRIGINPTQIPLGVDLETFRPDRRTTTPAEFLRLGICSRLSKEKRVDFVVDVIREATAQGLPVQLSVVGDGPERSKLEAAAAGLPVQFLGFVSDREVLADMLASFDVMFAPGPIETFGLAALEGLASGTPVVVNASSALPEVLGPAGAAAELDAKVWVDEIRRLTQYGVEANSAARLSARARAEKFPWSDFWRRLHRLHQELLNTHTAKVEVH